MTGFGAAEGPAGNGRLRVEIRTVNHRFFNFAPKLPNDLSALEPEVRERLRREFDRGHIAVQVRWVEVADRRPELSVNVDRARMVAERLRELESALGLGGGVSLELVARQPDVLVWGAVTAEDATWAELEPIVADAAAECQAMRAREGAALTTELLHRLDRLEEETREIGARAPGRLERERQRLAAGIGVLLEGRPLDEWRVAHEIAITADRLDVTEELVRFACHLVACRAALASDRPAGKQLGFLAQELGRETNTIGAKANDAEIAARVIGMKGELEKFREQLENIE